MFDVGQPLLSPPCPPAPPNQSLSNERQVGGYLGHLGSRHAPCWATLPLSCVKGKASSKTKLWRLPKCHNPIFLCFRSLTCVDRRGGGGGESERGRMPPTTSPRPPSTPRGASAGAGRPLGGLREGGREEKGREEKNDGLGVDLSTHAAARRPPHSLTHAHTPYYHRAEKETINHNQPWPPPPPPRRR